MKKFEIVSKIQNGKIVENRSEIEKAIKYFEDKIITITFELFKKKRSDNQNRYYWGVLIPLTRIAVKELWGEDWNIEETHEYLKVNLNYYEIVNEKTGEITRKTKSTTENTTVEMETYHLKIRMFLLEWFDIDAPEPNQNIIIEN